MLKHQKSYELLNVAHCVVQNSYRQDYPISNHFRKKFVSWKFLASFCDSHFMDGNEIFFFNFGKKKCFKTPEKLRLPECGSFQDSKQCVAVFSLFKYLTNELFQINLNILLK